MNLTAPFEVLFGNFSESQSKDFKDPVDEEECVEDYGYSSDSDLEEDDEKSPPEYLSKSEDHSSADGNCEEHVERGKVVKILDVAFVT